MIVLQITAHHEAMVTLLRDDVSLVEASGRSNLYVDFFE